MSQLTKISDEDLKIWGIFAPLSRFLIELNNNLERINDSLHDLEESLHSIKVAIDKNSNNDWDGEHQ